MEQDRKPLGKILVEMKVATVAQVKEALRHQMENSGKKLGEILIEQEVATPAQITEGLARQFDFPYVDLTSLELSGEIIQKIPRSVCDEHKIVPVKSDGKILTVAISDPLDLFTLDNLKFILNMELECVLAPAGEIQAAIERHYGSQQSSEITDAIEQATMTQTEISVRSSEIDGGSGPVEDDAPVIKFVQIMFAEAVKARASDIHVEPMEDRVRIRYRVDGLCHEVNSPPKRLQSAVLSRIKILAEMDIAEKRKPQDGRIKISVMGRSLDVRVSALPATHGESMVMRLLDKETSLIGLEELGFHPNDFKRFKTIIKRPNGIFLVTGPTGSGKTTTLYAALKELNRPDVKIITDR